MYSTSQPKGTQTGSEEAGREHGVIIPDNTGNVAPSTLCVLFLRLSY
jgi:hypothetical protein